MLAEQPGDPFLVAVRKVYLVQGARGLVRVPARSRSARRPATGVVGWWRSLGAAVWLLGVVFEAVGDAQLATFKADPANKGTVMDRGLWAWTRHPNYFGDSCVWWGIYLVAASAWPGALTVLSPVA